MGHSDHAGEARRRAAGYRAGNPGAAAEADERIEERARAERDEHRGRWVDSRIRAAMERGDFDDLPLHGKPLPDHVGRHDPDWWLKQLIEREQISGVLPPALALRREDAELRDVLDATGSVERVRELVEDFNRRVVEARRQLLGGPPVITALRDVETEVAAWRERRSARTAASPRSAPPEPSRPRRFGRWVRRRHSR